MGKKNDLILRALQNLNKDVPKDENQCMYKSGILDSYDVMQFVLELETISGLALNISKLTENDLTISAVNTELKRIEGLR
tara:strand:+ start:534 stop:773 length:240 start_codon:yes stop_codon:yes gene_type:complete